MSTTNIATDRTALVIALKSGFLHGKIPNKLERWGREVSRLLPEHEVHFMAPIESGGAHATNLLIDEFRLDLSNEWILFLEENELTPQQVAELVACKVGVVGAIYAIGQEPRWNAGFYPDIKAAENGLLLVAELEAGAKLYHRSVFDKLEPKIERYIFDSSGRSLPAFCQERLVQFGDYQRLLKPAMYLDSLCRSGEVAIYAHTKVIVGEKVPYKPWEHTRKTPPVIAEELPEAPKDERPILICIQYCDKDKEGAQRLRSHLEHMLIPATLVYSPGDKYPSGPNETALRIFRQDNSGFKGVLMIEPDCVPVSPDFLAQLSDSWDRASAAGKLIMGSWHPINTDHPTLGHINGNLMFDPRLASLVNIPDVPPKIPWDTYLADVFEPYWCRTGLIKNLNRHRTATVAQMTKPECGNRPPVLLHGIRDDSAWNLAKENATK